MSQDLKVFEVNGHAAFGVNKFQAPFRVEDKLLDEARVVHVVRGKSCLFAANQKVELNNGDTVVMRSDNFVNDWQPNAKGQSNKVVVFQLTQKYISDLYREAIPTWFNSIDDDCPSVVKMPDHPLIESYFESLQLYIEHVESLDEAYIRHKTMELIDLLVKTDNQGVLISLLGNLFVRKNHGFQEIIQQNLFSDLNLENLAFLCNMSLSSFKRKFKDVYGTSPSKYIVSKRLEKAQYLLQTSSLSISEIAYDCGFKDVSHFTKTFKKHYNRLPSDRGQ